jgi:hypothetical protein
VAGPVFISPKWRKPTPLGYANSIDSVGGVAAPLLAGFSLASVIVISQDAANFWQASRKGRVMKGMSQAEASLTQGTRTILPWVWPVASARWAAAVSASG